MSSTPSGLLSPSKQEKNAARLGRRAKSLAFVVLLLCGLGALFVVIDSNKLSEDHKKIVLGGSLLSLVAALYAATLVSPAFRSVVVGVWHLIRFVFRFTSKVVGTTTWALTVVTSLLQLVVTLLTLGVIVGIVLVVAQTARAIQGGEGKSFDDFDWLWKLLLP